MPIRASRKRLREQRAVGERADLAARGHPPDFSGRSQPEVDVAVGIDGQAFWELEGGRVEIDDRGDVFGKNGNRDHRPCQRDHHHQDRQQFPHLGFLSDCIVTQPHLESLLSSVDQDISHDFELSSNSNVVSSRSETSQINTRCAKQSLHRERSLAERA